LLFTSPNVHSKGIGYAAWCEIERLHPDPNGHYEGDGNTENEKDGMFRFQKKMKQTVSDM
jgi:hypothetical protein